MAVLLLVLGLSQITVSLGLPPTITRFTAESTGKGELLDSHVIRLAFATTLSISIAIGSVVVSFADSLSVLLFSTQDYSGALVLLGINIIVGGVYSSLVAGLLGLQRLKELAVLDICRFMLQQALIIVFLLLGWKLRGVVAGWIFGYSFFVVGAASLTLRGSHNRVVSLKELLAFSWPLYASEFVGFVYGWFDRALLVKYVPLAQLGVYNVAYTAFGVLATIPGAIATTLFPHYSELTGRHGSLKVAVRTASRYVAIIGTPLALGLAVTARPALSLFAGVDYEAGATILSILSVFLASTLIYSALGNILIVLKKPGLASTVTITSVFASLLSALVLLPQLGLNGMAVSRGLGMMILLALTLQFARKNIAVIIDTEALWKSALASIIMAVSVITVEVTIYSRYLLPLYAITGVAIYILMMRVLRAIRRSDIELVKAFLGRQWAPALDKLATLLLH